MGIPTLSEVRDEVKRVSEVIRRLETAEESAKAVSNEHVRSTVTNCLEVALKTLREDRNELEFNVKDSSSS